MDLATRLMARVALVLFMALGSGLASGYGTVGKEPIPERLRWSYSVPAWNLYSGFDFDAPRAAADAGAAAAAKVFAGGLCSPSFSSTTGSTFFYNMMSGADRCGQVTVSVASKSFPATQVCPTGSNELGNGTCECALNFKPEGGKCVRYDCPAKGSYSAQVSPDVKLPNAGDSFCSGGCTVTPSSWKVDQEGQVWGVWPMKSANQACGGKKDQGGAALGDDQLPEAPVACSSNQCPGSVNGVSVCVPCKSATTPGPSSSASGAQPGDPPKDPADPDSAVKGSTSQTTCVGAICTTVTKYFDGKGNEVGSKTEEQSETDYCQKNPSASQCKKDSFGGACEGGFTCEGDAVECALAKEVHTRNCQWFKQPSQAILDAGDRALTGGDRPPGHPAGEAETKSFALSSLIDMSNPLPGSCPSDVAVTVGGAAYVVPFSRMCSDLDLIGRAMVAMCLLAAAGIVFRGS